MCRHRMNQALFQELRTIRAEIARGRRPADVDADYLANRLQESGISVPPSDLPWVVTFLVQRFRELDEYIVPPFLVDVVHSLLEGRSANLACDPWAGIGVLAAGVHEVVHARKTFACARY